MTSQDIAYLRLANHGLAGGFEGLGLAEIVARMGAMQGQDYYNCLWTLGVRSGQTEAQVIQSLESHQVVRTWPQRGTLHLLAAQDVSWQVALSAERIIKKNRRRYEELGLDTKLLDKCGHILGAALSKDPLTRPQAVAVLEAAGIPMQGGRTSHVIGHLSITGMTFVGPMVGKQQSFGLVSALATQRKLDHEAGVAELTRRYFTSHGPATVADFVWWSGLTVKDVRSGLVANGDALEMVEADGKQYWLPKVALQSSVQPDHAYLLPAFDEYFIGYADRSAVVSKEDFLKVVPGGNGVFFPTIVIDGRIAGTWKRTIKKDRVIIALEPFKKLSKIQMAALQIPLEQYGTFLGLEPVLA